MVRVALPYHLRNLAKVDGEVQIELAGKPTARGILDALETRFPALQGTIRDHVTRDRRAYLRYFCCGQDISFQPPDQPLPDAVAAGKEPFMVVGAISGG